MFFDKEFIGRVEENPVEGLIEACNIALARIKEIGNEEYWTEEEHELLWDASTFVYLVLKANSLCLDRQLPPETTDLPLNCQRLLSYLKDVSTDLQGHFLQIKIRSYKKRYDAALRSSFAYEFSKGDLDRVQVLVNEIRVHISESDRLEQDHKLRLLKRLESLQLELHKRVSDLDRFWGLVGDAGVVLAKLGNDAKPIVDRIREVTEIIWKTQARTEELPSGAQISLLESNNGA